MTELFDILYQFKSTGAEKVKADMDSLGASTEKAEQSTSRFGDIATIAAGILTSKYAVSTALWVREGVIMAAQAETLSNAFQRLTSRVGEEVISLEQLRQSTRNTVADVDLLRSANNALSLGLPIERLGELFEAAQVVGNAMGRTTLEAVNDLTTGIGRQSRLILDNLGIIVNTDQAYRDFAETLGKTASQLTDAERKTAFMTAAITELSDKSKVLSGSVSENQILLERWGAWYKNAQISVGSFAGASITAWAGLAGKISEFSTATIDSTESMFTAFSEVNETALRETFRDTEDLYAKTKTLGTKFKGVYEDVGESALGMAGQVVNGFKYITDNFAISLSALQNMMDARTKAIADVWDEIDRLRSAPLGEENPWKGTIYEDLWNPQTSIPTPTTPTPEPTPTPTPTTRTIYTAMCPYCGYTAESENKTTAMNEVYDHIRSAHPGYAISASISSRTVRAAAGFEGIVTRPTMILAGESGEEKVSVKPLRGPDTGGGMERPRQPINIVLTLDGRIIASYVHDLEIDDIRSFGYQT